MQYCLTCVIITSQQWRGSHCKCFAFKKIQDFLCENIETVNPPNCGSATALPFQRLCLWIYVKITSQQWRGSHCKCFAFKKI